MVNKMVKFAWLSAFMSVRESPSSPDLSYRLLHPQSVVSEALGHCSFNESAYDRLFFRI